MLTFGELSIDIDNREAIIGGVRVEGLSRAELELLNYLVIKQGEIIEKNILDNKILGDKYPTSRRLGVTELPVKRINETIKKYSISPLIIETENGYYLNKLKKSDLSLFVINFNNQEFVLEKLKVDKNAIETASKELKNNKQFILKSLEIWPDIVNYADEKLQNDQEFILKVIRKLGEVPSCKDDKNIINDKFIILKVLKKWSKALRYASEELKNDKEVVLEAIKIDGASLEYASEELKNDKEVVLKAVQKNGCALRDASEELKNDKEVVLKAVQKNGFALGFASEELKNDKEIVLKALKAEQTSGFVLKLASEKLKNDKEVVLQAVEANIIATVFIGEELKNNDEFMLQVDQIKKSFFQTNDKIEKSQHKQENVKRDVFGEIRKYKQLLDEGIITDEEFKQKKKKLMDI